MHGVGFLSDVRRLNTAITRARCLLAVVGDPYVLYQVRAISTRRMLPATADD